MARFVSWVGFNPQSEHRLNKLLGHAHAHAHAEFQEALRSLVYKVWKTYWNIRHQKSPNKYIWGLQARDNWCTLPTVLCSHTVSFHNFKSQNFKLSVSNPKNIYVVSVSVLSQISNCQGLGRKNKHHILKTDRTVGKLNLSCDVIVISHSSHQVVAFERAYIKQQSPDWTADKSHHIPW